jgi:16S rRNA (guanine527-N7)-methyltransferase
MVPSELQRTLEEGLSALSRPCAPDQLLELVELSTLLEQWSGRMNLTGHRSAVGIAKRLILDAAALLDLLPPFERLADLGSGAGFPGLPLAILEPEREFVLVEARERRHHFQREAIRRLGLRNVTSLRGRFEELEPLECGAVVAQAVAPPARLIDAMLRWAGPGASLLIPGGPRPPSLPADPRIREVRTGSYRVPPDDWARSYWLGVRQPALS